VASVLTANQKIDLLANGLTGLVSAGLPAGQMTI
jgi:hypothetical protein